MKTKELISQTLSKKISKILYVVLTLIVSAALQVFCILILRTLIDNIFQTPVAEEPKLAFWIGSFVVSLLLLVGIGLVTKNLVVSISTNVSTSLTNAAYSASLRSEINEFEKFDKELIATKIVNDANYIGEVYIGRNWFVFFRNLIYIIGYFISMMIISPVLGAIAFGALPIFYMLVRSYDKYFGKLDTKATTSYDARANKIKDDLVNLRSIKLRNGIVLEEEEMAKINEEYIATKKTHSLLKDVKDHKLFDLLVGLLLALLLGIGGYQSTRFAPIPGTITAVVLMTPIVYRLFSQLMYNTIMPSFIENELESLEEIISVRSELKAEPISSLDEIHSFKFQNVTYTVNSLSINDVNFELKRGEKLGVLSIEDNNDRVMFDLLTKLVRPKEGIISINNCDFNKINTIYLRSLITAIPDERNLFRDTIANNIIYPLEFDEYKYNDALNKSGLKDFLVNLEDKDKTILDPSMPINEELKQRIIFANAFYKDSKIFILNETNSKLEPRKEEQLIQEIFELKNKITIILTDKNYSVLKCDKVLILGKDEVLEYGRVDELLEDKTSVLSSLIKKVKTTKSAKVS